MFEGSDSPLLKVRKPPNQGFAHASGYKCGTTTCICCDREIVDPASDPVGYIKLILVVTLLVG